MYPWCHTKLGSRYTHSRNRSLYSGRIADWLVLKLARRNKGVMESEQRLWLFALSAILIPGGLILWGVGAAHGVHWFGVVFAMGVIGFTNTLGTVISISYCIDSYRELSGEAIVTVILVRNTMGFAIGYWSANPHPTSFLFITSDSSILKNVVASRHGSPTWVSKTPSSSPHSQALCRFSHSWSLSSTVVVGEKPAGRNTEYMWEK